MKPPTVHGPFNAQAALADPSNHIVTIANHADWTTHEVTAPIPDDADTVAELPVVVTARIWSERQPIFPPRGW
jgi:hypothetical protein